MLFIITFIIMLLVLYLFQDRLDERDVVFVVMCSIAVAILVGFIIMVFIFIGANIASVNY